MTQAIGLADDKGVQAHAIDKRLLLRLLQHLVEVVDDHVCERPGVAVMQHDHRDVVDLMRIGQAEQPAPPGLDPHRLIVHRPVEDVGVAGLLQEVGGSHRWGVDPGAEPAGWRPAFVPGDGFGGFPDERRLAGLVKVVLMLGIGAAVADDFIAAGAGRRR